LAIPTSAKSPYDDGEVETGFRYAYRAGSIELADNRALRASYDLRVPLVYFVATRAGWYRPEYPSYVLEDDPIARAVVISRGRWIGPLDEREPAPILDPVERRYAIRETKVRLHQARFRGRVLAAYRDSCAICRLKQLRLLDAAHIIGDMLPAGEPAVSNGLSLCSIHHRAFDQDLVGISPDYEVRVSRRLLEDDDGPMLELLKTAHAKPIVLPDRLAWRPDRDQLAVRFERFETA
jgi:putative restriction endonuclease